MQCTRLQRALCHAWNRMLDDVATTLIIVINEEEQRMQQTPSSSTLASAVLPDADVDEKTPHPQQPIVILVNDEVLVRPPTPMRVPSPSTRQRIHKSAVIEECIIQMQQQDGEWVMSGLP